ncbi:MAG: succinate dehydrogenase, cytochrome b556 subunit [Pseudomonadota bacterium]
MADVNRGDRPLSPHIEIYKPQITWVPSIVHRVTGVGLTVGLVLLVWWFFAAATGPEAFATADWFLSTWFGQLILLGSAWALCYHTLNGIRHLFWDAGYGFDLANASASAWAVIIGSVVLTGLLWVVA